MATEETPAVPRGIELARELIEEKAPGRALHSMRVEEDGEGNATNIILFLKAAD